MSIPFSGVPLHAQREWIEELVDLGYTDVWSSEADGSDGFTPLALASVWGPSLRLGVAIIPAFTRGPATLAQSVAALAQAAPGRFVLGLGSSSNVIVERWNEVPFEKPLSKVRAAVESLRPVLAGDRGIGGFKLEQTPRKPVPIYVAALRDKMLALAGEVGDGAWVNFLPLSGVEHVVEQIRAGEQAGGKEPGSGDVVCRFFCIPQPVEQAMPLARHMFAAYATVPVYEAYFRGLGWGDHIDGMVQAWRGGDRQRALELAPPELIEEIFIFGEPEAQKERLDEFAARGITTLVLTPITGPRDIPDLIAALAR